MEENEIKEDPLTVIADEIVQIREILEDLRDTHLGSDEEEGEEESEEEESETQEY